MNLLQMILGSPLIEVVALESKLQAERAKYLVADLKEAPCEEGKAQTLCNYILERQKEAEQLRKRPKDEKSPPVPFRFINAQGLQIDLRLCNQDIISSAKPHLLHILNAAIQDWIPEQRQELLKEYRSRGITDEDETAFLLKKDIAQAYYERVCQMILNDKGIERLGSGVAQLLVNQAQTAKIIEEVIDEEIQGQNDHQKVIEGQFGQSHPLLSRVKSWLRRQLKRALETYCEDNRWRPHTEAIQRCKSNQLEQSAYFLTKDLAFRKDHEPILTKELRKFCKQPAKNFEFETRIWKPQNWVVTEHASNGETHVVQTVVEEDPGDDTLNYVPHHHEDHQGFTKWSSIHQDSALSNTENTVNFSVSKKTVHTNNSGYLGWRWLNFIQRTNAFFWNYLFIVTIVIPWCSGLSLRALWYTHPFYPEYVLDRKTGVIRRDRNSKTHTVLSRITTLWTHIAESRKDFETKPDTGLISKDITRHIHKFVNYVIKGFGGTALILAFLPISMVLVSSFSLCLALLSPIYIWVGSAALHFLAFLFCDFEGQDYWSAALVPNLLINFVGIGILQPLFCALVAFLVCPFLSLIGAMLALVRKGLRDAYDTVIFQLLIKIHARVPISDNFLAKRLSGPGMAATYYFQIKIEQALAALETAMDLDRLMAYHVSTFQPYHACRFEASTEISITNSCFVLS